MEVLISAGWNEDLALSLDDVYRKAFCILHLQRTGNGGKFNFTTGEWEGPKNG